MGTCSCGTRFEVVCSFSASFPETKQNKTNMLISKIIQNFVHLMAIINLRLTRPQCYTKK